MKKSGAKSYLLIALLGALAFNLTDRLALGLAMQNIKIELDLTDTQLGVLTGIVFAVFYTVLGIPIARWADKGNRVHIISITTALSAIMIAACGLATNFAQLALARIGVAVGEAGTLPASHSLIADRFERSERPRAVSIFLLGGPISGLVGYFFGGWFNEVLGWRMMFALLGIPGLLLALAIFFLISDPRSSAAPIPATVVPLAKEDAAAADQSPTFLTACSELWRIATFRHLLIFSSVASFFAYGIGQWNASFVIRGYGIGTAELGMWFALIYGTGGLIGTLVGGELASRLAASDERIQLRGMAAVYGIFAVIGATPYIVANLYLVFLLLWITAIAHAMTSAPLFATIQTLVPSRMRAVSIAIMALSANLIGMGLGPLAAGMISDAVRPWAGDASLKYSLLILCPGYFWCAWHLWCASRFVTEDIARAEDLPTSAVLAQTNRILPELPQ